MSNCFKLYALLFRVAIDFFVMEMMIHCINADTVSRKNSQPSRPYSLLTLPHGLIFVSNTYSCFFLYSRVFPVQSTAINALKNCIWIRKHFVAVTLSVHTYPRVETFEKATNPDTCYRLSIRRENENNIRLVSIRVWVLDHRSFYLGYWFHSK